jgi:hypothetical protein
MRAESCDDCGDVDTLREIMEIIEDFIVGIKQAEVVED